MWEGERVVEMMKVVDAALGERGFGPGGLGEVKGRTFERSPESELRLSFPLPPAL